MSSPYRISAWCDEVPKLGPPAVPWTWSFLPFDGEQEIELFIAAVTVFAVAAVTIYALVGG
jgi:hypothetical protein